MKILLRRLRRRNKENGRFKITNEDIIKKKVINEDFINDEVFDVGEV